MSEPRQMTWGSGEDRGSTVPLILGFFLIALLFVGGAVMASDAFTRQRDLQSICDGSAGAGANAVDFSAVRSGGLNGSALPLGQLQAAVQAYLDRDPARRDVIAVARASADGQQVSVSCTRQSKLAFAALFGKGRGITQHASATARSPLQ